MIRRPLVHACALASTIALTAYAALAQTAAPAAPLDAEKMLPIGRTLAFVSVADFAKAEAAFQTTDLGAIWQQLEPFRKELEKGLGFSMTDMEKKFEQDTGTKLEDVLRALKGGMAAGVVDMAIPDAANPAPAFVVALSKEHKPVVEALVRKALEGQGGPGGGTAQGPPPVTVMEHGNAVLVITDTGALAQPGGKTLGDDPVFQGLRTKMVGAQGTAFVLAYGNVEAVLARAMKKDPASVDVLRKSGALDCRAIGMSLGVADGRLRESIAVAAPGERHGFARLLSSGKPLDPVQVASATPADVLSFGAMRFDALKMLDELIGVVRTLDENGAKEMEKGIAELEKELKLKIREDLLAPLGDLVTVESCVPEDGLFPESVTTITLKDPVKVEAALGKLAKLAGLTVKTVDRGGKQYKYLQAPLGKIGDDPTQGMSEEQLGASMAFGSFMGSWVVDGGTLYLSALPQTLEDRFERVAKGTLAGTEQYRTLAARAPQGLRAFSYNRTRPIVGGVYHVLLHALRAFEPAIRKGGVPIDTALLPRVTSLARPMGASTAGFLADADGFQITSQGGLPILTALPVIAAIAIPNMIQQKRAQEEAMVQSALYQLHSAQSTYQAEKGGFAASMAELKASESAGPMLMYIQLPPSHEFAFVAADKQSFLIEARPADRSKRTLIVDESGFVRGKGEPNPFAQPPPMPPEPPEPTEPPEAPEPPAGPGGGGKDGNE